MKGINPRRSRESDYRKSTQGYGFKPKYPAKKAGLVQLTILNMLLSNFS